MRKTLFTIVVGDRRRRVRPHIRADGEDGFRSEYRRRLDSIG
jgi:hypothetical protein